MGVLDSLVPQNVFKYFEKICSIPHGSGHTDEISDYLVSFAKEHSLRYIQDEMGNVVIFKDASEGYENAPTVMLQGHMDMVCQKRADVEIDFEKDGLNLGIEDGYIHANGTTLGGDDGIALAYGLALLEDDSLQHPAIEFVATVDEEIGLLGADGLDTSELKSSRLINLDSEEEGIIWVGCAGGLSAYSHIPVSYVKSKGTKVCINMQGLLGGHSGAEIHTGRASAVKLMGRFLYELLERMDYGLVAFRSGDKDNAIPRDAFAEIMIDAEDLSVITEYAKTFEKNIASEYAGIEEGIALEIIAGEEYKAEMLTPVSLTKVLFYLVNVPFGVQKMSGTIEGLVETSMNVGITELKDSELLCISSLRSSVSTGKHALSDKVRFLTEFLGGDYDVKGEYPAWEYRQDSPLRDKMVEVYRDMYQAEPQVAAIHAGLECGLFYEKIADLDAVSIGPNMKDIHTSEEKLSIESTVRVWNYLIAVLKELKN